MTRRTLYLPALIVAAVLVACAGALLAVSEKAEATFPGKNGKIAYVSNDGSDYEIYTINPGGGGKIQLTHDNTGNYVPAYSPNGKRIAYTGLNRNYDKSAIYTISVRGGGKSKVTEGSDPSYSPDGKKIAYTVYKGPFTGIYKINVGGGSTFRVTSRLEYAESPSWRSRP
jgi:TolB protein